MKKTIIFLIATSISYLLMGQSGIEQVLKQIEANNPTLAKLQAQNESAKLENLTALTPEDPEAEFGYMWGSPGGKKNISVKQAFDFPSLYSSKKALSVQKNNSLDFGYKAERMELLLQAKQTCLELVYYNALKNLYTRQMNNSRTIAQAYSIMLDKGETNIMEYNKAQMNLAGMEVELARVEAERKALLAKLEGLNGGNPVVLEDSVFSSVMLPADYITWYEEAKDSNPALAYFESKVAEADKAVYVSKRSALPKISVGFAGEYLKTEKFSGVTVGMTIPLWANRGKVRQAKSEVLSARKQYDDAKLSYGTDFKARFIKASALQKVVADYRRMFSDTRADELLYKAYKGGELSLLNYLLEMEYFFSNYDKYLQAQRDLAQAVAELEAFRL